MNEPTTVAELYATEGETSPRVPAGWLTTGIDGDVVEILYISTLKNSSTHYRVALVNHAINLLVHGNCAVWRRADNERISVSDWCAYLPTAPRRADYMAYTNTDVLYMRYKGRKWMHHIPDGSGCAFPVYDAKAVSE